MKAVQLDKNQKFVYTDVEEAKVGSKDVRIKVFAAGICGSDTHKIATGWKYDLPAIMGHEFSGEIIEVGSEVTKYSIGDRVVGMPLLPCHECEYCERGLYGMCENYKMIGTHFGGAFAENLVIPERNVLPIGDMSYEDAAMIEPLAVAMHSVMNVGVEIGDTAVVLGTGTIGLFTIKTLLLAGAKYVIAVDINNDKIEAAKDNGAMYGINSLEEDLQARVMEITNGLGADIVMECAGSKITQEQALLLAKKRGKVGYTGIAYSDVLMHEKPFENIFRRELTVKGFWNSYSAPFPGKEWTNLIDFINQGRIKLDGMVTHRYPLSGVADAFDMILSRKESYNKVMIFPQEGVK
ncbi:galactitol-1-phosphate 5-dehydrogenase [Eremococcus coleocola]|uniref:GroES-like protein n=1 Tax=Eremococcus coleocola ACS-139-V-Col8 TaxID=908337 RepID=E4KN69_9LACT|nr:galactitol-1-phosphate 5-dehydrogenase [Eremococcus coleocola]EFR31733.1 GroES-like protein [Eremococcus coleocola ACS-139-V-Col8]